MEQTLNTELNEVYSTTSSPNLELQCQLAFPKYGTNTYPMNDAAVKKYHFLNNLFRRVKLFNE
jgi:hypothetical protein